MRHRHVLPRAGSRMSLYPAVAIVAGAALALVTVTLDEAVQVPWLPWLPLASSSSAQALLSGVAGGMITAAAVLFWVRAMLVQLAADQFSPRVLQPYLDNRLQRGLMAFVIGTFVYSAVALLHQSGSPGATPVLTLLVAIGLATGVLLAIVGALVNGARSTRIEEVVHAVADETLQAVRRHHPERGPNGGEPHGRPQEPDGDAHVVRANTAGWVRWVSGETLLAALPPGSTAHLEVGTGDFVGTGTPVCAIWPPPDHPAAIDVEVHAAIGLGRERSRDGDIVLGLRELVDVATASLAPGTPDSTAGLETIVHLGVVIRELLRRDPPPSSWADDAGRRVHQVRTLTLDDYVGLAFDQIRTRFGDDLTTASTLLKTLGRVAHDLDSDGNGDRAVCLRRQAELVVATFAHSDPLDDDLEEIRRIARTSGFAAEARAPAAR